MRAYIQPYKTSSESAALLGDALGVKRIKSADSAYQPKAKDVIINWGSKTLYNGVIYLNHPNMVAYASNKLKTFEVFDAKEVMTVPWTRDKSQAMNWMLKGSTVMVRHLLNSSEGNGIEVYRTDMGFLGLPDAPLYTQYVKKLSEFRVHVFNGEVIDVCQKRKKIGYKGESVPEIRSHQYGWVFCREDIEEPGFLRPSAVKAIKALGLNFGAVDIIYNQQKDRCYVLEVNTAPGIEGTTVELYAKSIKAYLQKQEQAHGETFTNLY